MKYIKIITLSLSLVVLSALAFVGVANAQSFKTGNMITIASNETVDGMLFVAGNNINIAGNIKGDVYCAGQTITISGNVDGDVICAGQTIAVSGKVEGNLRIAGQSVTLSGFTANSATIGAQDLLINNDAIISRDLLGGSQNVTINGLVGRDMVAGANNLIINGKVNRNINGGVENLLVGSTGNIGGYVNYIGTKDPSISDGGKIMGAITRTEPKKETKTYYSPMGFSIAWFVYTLIAAIALGLMLVGLFPRLFDDASSKTLKTPGKTALVGFIACVATPFLIMILMMSVIGIPIAVLLIFIWIIIMILSGPFTGYLLGKVLMRKSKQPIWIMITGISLLVIVHFIPILGFLAFVATSLFGTGMVLIESKKLLQRSTK